MTQELVTNKKQTELGELLETYKGEIARALPKHVTPERMLRIAMTSARKNPTLLECSLESILGAVIQSAQLGLEVDTPLGHAYLVPFYNKNSGKKECNFMPGYRGLMDLIHRTAGHPILDPTAVYEGDHFKYEKGLHPVLQHEPIPKKGGEKLTYVYCVASFADGRNVFRVMTRGEVESHRMRSKDPGFKIWKSDYEAMALKTVIRQLAKYLPMSAELQVAVGLDEMHEVGIAQDNELILKQGQPIHTKRERIEAKMASNPDDFEHFEDK
jgi:recombination protein RecT